MLAEIIIFSIDCPFLGRWISIYIDLVQVFSHLFTMGVNDDLKYADTSAYEAIWAVCLSCNVLKTVNNTQFKRAVSQTSDRLKWI